MPKSKRHIEVQGQDVAIIARGPADYISLTDIARYRNSQEPFTVINNWMRSRSTIEFLGLWEKLRNPDFIPIEFERFNSVEQLLVLANIEGMNAELIHMGLSQPERLKRLNQSAIRQMEISTSSSTALPAQ